MPPNKIIVLRIILFIFSMIIIRTGWVILPFLGTFTRKMQIESEFDQEFVKRNNAIRRKDNSTKDIEMKTELSNTDAKFRSTDSAIPIDIVSLTVAGDFFTLFNSSAMISWIRYIQNVRSVTFIGPPSDYFSFHQNMIIHNQSIVSSFGSKSIPIKWINETHWLDKYKKKYRCIYPSVCQQLIKLHVFDMRTYLGLNYIGDNILIVDSDTVWSREATFVHPNNTVTYFERMPENPRNATCGGQDPVRFTEAISIGPSGKAVAEEDADAYNYNHTRTPYKSCIRPLYPDATGARHIVHHMVFQHDVMTHLHKTITDAWGASSVWQAVTLCHKFTFCKSRVAEYELYYSFMLEHYPERMHIEQLTAGVDWMNSAICDSKEMKCCHEKNVLLKGCHDHRIRQHEEEGDNPGDMCCELY